MSKAIKREFKPYIERYPNDPKTSSTITPKGHGAYGSRNEQQLISSMQREMIELRGNDYLYLPRNDSNIDNLFGEHKTNELKKAIPLRMYLEETQGFGGNGYSLETFGLQIDQSATLLLSKENWLEKTVNSNLKNKYGEQRRPFENDFIWDRTTNSLFIITYVDKQNPFYLVGDNYIYKLNVKLAPSDIDSLNLERSKDDDVNLGKDTGEFNSAVINRALGIKNTSNGVMKLMVENGGTLYTNENIIFTFAPAEGETSTNIIEPTVDLASIIIENNSLVSVSILNPGSGYDLPPVVSVMKSGVEDYGESAVVRAVLNTAEIKTIEKTKGIVQQDDETDNPTKIAQDLIEYVDNPLEGN